MSKVYIFFLHFQSGSLGHHEDLNYLKYVDHFNLIFSFGSYILLRFFDNPFSFILFEIINRRPGDLLISYEGCKKFNKVFG